MHLHLLLVTNVRFIEFQKEQLLPTSKPGDVKYQHPIKDQTSAGLIFYLDRKSINVLAAWTLCFS